ncbi:MAG: nicotinate (nicotinamide) nucleotide adenylyltransferase [Lachnospiraceae bacterium]|nr:nicotinate (nicotinamide) nucleotide adenylyltransferase [Lachnospiraceae bacterium]
MNIGILGGTFSPIHNAHVNMAVEAYKELNLDKVIIMPLKTPPHKYNIIAANHRFNMAKLATKDYPYIEVSDYELTREGTTYTADTLSMLKRENPDNTYTFIVGADSFMYMEKWYHPEILFANAVVGVFKRNGISDEELYNKKTFFENSYNARIKLLKTDCINISSSEIRDHIKNRMNRNNNSTDDILSLVPSNVLEYIYNNALY